MSLVVLTLVTGAIFLGRVANAVEIPWQRAPGM